MIKKFMYVKPIFYEDWIKYGTFSVCTYIMWKKYNCPDLIAHYSTKLRAFICCVYLLADDAICPHGHRQVTEEKMHFILVSNVSSTEVLGTLLLHLRLQMGLPFYTVI